MLNRPLIVIGGIALDITATVGKSLSSILHTSTPGIVKQSLGGVSRNVAETAWRTGGYDVKLVSVVGDDLAGQSVKAGMTALGMNTAYIQTLEDQPTAVYNAIHSHDGQLVAAVADMNIFNFMDQSKIVSILKAENPNFVCFDGNITSDMMRTIATTCQLLSIPVFFEPTSVPKSLKLFEHVETIQIGSIKFASPNQFELEAMCDKIKSSPVIASSKPITTTPLIISQLKIMPKLAQTMLPHAIYLSNYIPNIVTKLGQEGCLYVGQNAAIQYYSPEHIDAIDIKSVTGAGDSFVGTLIANLQRHNRSLSLEKLNALIHKSQLSAIRTLKSNLAVSAEIGCDLLVNE